MSVESADDRAAFIADFGVDITWAGAPATFLGIFERPAVSTEDGYGAGGTDRVPKLLCLESSLPAGADEDDAVSVAGEAVAYACARILPDGTGFCVVELKAAGT
ncbi:head-tail joining protein [Reyranella sp.]|uniref:head-tail joining protein n=1 Tax=Reyranella sp. TaxID=1929291 RepID=UPI003C7BD5BB